MFNLSPIASSNTYSSPFLTDIQSPTAGQFPINDDDLAGLFSSSPVREEQQNTSTTSSCFDGSSSYFSLQEHESFFQFPTEQSTVGDLQTDLSSLLRPLQPTPIVIQEQEPQQPQQSQRLKPVVELRPANPRKDFDFVDISTSQFKILHKNNLIYLLKVKNVPADSKVDVRLYGFSEQDETAVSSWKDLTAKGVKVLPLVNKEKPEKTKEKKNKSTHKGTAGSNRSRSSKRQEVGASNSSFSSEQAEGSTQGSGKTVDPEEKLIKFSFGVTSHDFSTSLNFLFKLVVSIEEPNQVEQDSFLDTHQSSGILALPATPSMASASSTETATDLLDPSLLGTLPAMHIIESTPFKIKALKKIEEDFWMQTFCPEEIDKKRKLSQSTVRTFDATVYLPEEDEDLAPQAKKQRIVTSYQQLQQQLQFLSFPLLQSPPSIPKPKANNK